MQPGLVMCPGAQDIEVEPDTTPCLALPSLAGLAYTRSYVRGVHFILGHFVLLPTVLKTAVLQYKPNFQCSK